MQVVCCSNRPAADWPRQNRRVFGEWCAEHALELVTSLGFAGFALLLLAMPLAFWAVSSQSRDGLVRLLVAVANLLFTAQLILRWWQSGHFLISNLLLCFLAWACTLTQLLVE